MTKFQHVLHTIDIAEVADSLDLARSTVYRWRRGLAKPDPQRAAQLIAWLEGKNITLDFNAIYTTECVSDGEN